MISLIGAAFQLLFSLALTASEITPYKIPTDVSMYEGLQQLKYVIPSSSIYRIPRLEQDAPPITYYLSMPPKVAQYAIAILCTGSSSRESIMSVIHLHRYLLQEFLDLQVGVLTVEQRGVDGDSINVEEFMAHYTRTARLEDHQHVIEHLINNPPEGWNGNIIFLGVSEGGPLVISLTELYADRTWATINWCGAGDWSWREELWVFIEALDEVYMLREEYDRSMDETLKNPVISEEFMGMTHRYHADALQYPDPNYAKLTRPFLVVAGTEDSIIHSSDAFVATARSFNCPITYLRVEGMNHYIRKHPDVIAQSFEWLKEQQPSIHDQISYEASKMHFLSGNQTTIDIGC